MSESAPGTLGKTLSVLEDISRIGRPVRFNELLAQSTHPKATLYRLLQTLTDQGMLQYDPETRHYRLGARLVRLAHAAWQQASLAPIAREHIDLLSANIEETVHLAQLESGQVLYVDKRNARSPIMMNSKVGRISPAYCTGVGKAMLAFLDDASLKAALKEQSFHGYTPNTLTTPRDLLAVLEQVRQTGQAYDREEHEPQIICVAVPILSPKGRVLGGLSVTSNTMRHSLDDLGRFVPEIQYAAKKIGEDAEIWQFPGAIEKGV